MTGVAEKQSEIVKSTDMINSSVTDSLRIIYIIQRECRKRQATGKNRLIRIRNSLKDLRRSNNGYFKRFAQCKK